MRSKPSEITHGRRGERGAALVMSLLVAMLLLAAGGALIASAGMTVSNAVDATAEAQAYHAADAGLQAALTVARRNRAVRTGVPATPANFHTFACGTTAACVNDGNDLSQWLTYVSGRVVLSASPALSYTVRVTDPSRPATANLPANYHPRYLHVRVVGYGPQGAVKVMEMMLDDFPFDFTARAAIAIRSNDTDNVGMNAFTLGSSNPHEWTGNDLAGHEPPLPAFVVTNTADYDAGDGFGSSTAQGRGEAAIESDNENVSGQTLLEKLNPQNLESWLKDANEARALLTAMRAKAAGMGRLNPSDYGTTANPKFSFVDGDASGDGAGLMIVTGNWSQGGSTKFHGIILALGNGVVARNGNPDTIGAVVLANFQHNYNSATGAYTGTGGFGSPTITTAGGGNSLVGYDSEWVRKAMDTLGNRVVGVVEK
jgi:Flp pilus assembly protein TadG